MYRSFHSSDPTGVTMGRKRSAIAASAADNATRPGRRHRSRNTAPPAISIGYAGAR